MKKELKNTETEQPVEAEQTPVQTESAPAEEAKPVNKLFNIVTLAFAGVLLFAQIFLMIAMCTGIVAADGVTLNSADLTHFFKLVVLRKNMYDVPTFICLCIVAVFWLIVLVTVIIGLIKAFIGFFKFVKLGEEYESREARFSKYTRTVSRSYGNALMLIIGSLAVSSSFTAMGCVVVVLGCVIYLASSAIVILFKQVLNKEEKFNLFELIVNVGKKLVMFMFAFLLVANVKESFNVGLENIFLSNYTDNGDGAMATTYFNVAQPMSLICLYFAVAACIADIVKYYPLNNAKKDINIRLKKSFIGILVLTLIFCIADCVVYGLSYDATAGDYAKMIAYDYLAFILVSIAGIVLTFSVKKQKEEIRG